MALDRLHSKRAIVSPYGWVVGASMGMVAKRVGTAVGNGVKLFVLCATLGGRRIFALERGLSSSPGGAVGGEAKGSGSSTKSGAWKPAARLTGSVSASVADWHGGPGVVA